MKELLNSWRISMEPVLNILDTPIAGGDRRRIRQHWIQLFPALLSFFLLVFSSCSPEKERMEVTATAYNSHPYQTRPNTSGNITAWGDTLREGMRCIAVSRDLIDSGLTHDTRVWIEGFEGYFLVKDKMARRWTRKIDIYFGEDIEKAEEWGKKEVTISYRPPAE